MSLQAFPALRALLRRLHLQLGMECAVHALCAGLAGAGGLLFLSGLVHKAFLPVHWLHAGLAAGLVMLLVLGLLAARFALTPIDVPAVADARLHAKQLLYAAYEQVRLAPAERAGAGAVVLQRAERLASSASAGALRRWPKPTDALAPMALAALGLVLLLSSPYQDPSADEEGQAASPPATESMERVPFMELQSDFAELRTVALASQPEGRGSDGPVAPREGSRAPEFDPLAPGEPLRAHERLAGDLDDVNAWDDRSSPLGGVQPDKAVAPLGRDADYADSVPGARAQRQMPLADIDLPATFSAIERRDGTRGRLGVEIVTADSQPAHAEIERDAARRATRPARLRFMEASPEVRHYVAEYLGLLHRDP